MGGPSRVTRGLLTDPARPIRFRFDGRVLQGLAGDTLASALLANGVRLTGRSFKYHRPRGIVTAGPEEPCALVDVLGPSGREPNRLATTLELHEGLSVESQNRWPSLRFDLGALSDCLGRFLPAGFYYKTFMAPQGAWEEIYEPLIRRAAGLGRLEPVVAGQPADTVHDHTDVLIVGGGSAGLAAARALGARQLRVMLLEQDVVLGGGSLLAPRWDVWRENMCRLLRTMKTVRCLTRTTVLGAYGHGVFGALETLPAGEAQAGCRRERLHIIRAQRVVLATGSIERLIAFPGNDRPGVMLAGSAVAYLRRYGVAVGRRPAVFVNSDEAYQTVFALLDAGIECAGVIDVRPESLASELARSRGVAVYGGAFVEGVSGYASVRSIGVNRQDGGRRRTLRADCLLISGGYTPATALASQLGASLTWQDDIAGFSTDLDPGAGWLAGAARGTSGLAAAADDGDAAGRVASAQLAPSRCWPDEVDYRDPCPPDQEVTPLAAVWEVPGRGKAFVDLQNDVTVADVRLAHREGYEHVEHMKRYTTHAMATDQGRIGGLVGSAVLAQARRLPLSDVGMSRPRPFAQPVPFAALAGAEIGQDFKPRRRLPLHELHEASGATFVGTGLWLRPLVYSTQSGWEPVLAEARAVRRSVGICDVSSLGKIDVQGPDAAQFLDLVYASPVATLPVGRARYGILLREDGMMLDDGTVTRLAPDHFILSTTTANANVVLEHLEFHLQATWPALDVIVTDVGDQWAQLAVAGPRARQVVNTVLAGIDLANSAFPFMAAATANIAGVPGRVFRISFSGELAYELAVPARHAAALWQALLASGEPFGMRPYGLDALNTLRIEKGHVTGAELNGNTTPSDLGLARMLKTHGDYIGRALLSRPGLSMPARQQLVGVRPVNRAHRLRNGMHLVAPEAPEASLGYITSSTPSTELDGWVGLALLSAGRERIGQRLFGVSPVHGECSALAIVSPHMLDPENLRVRT
jgi:sarcosine oxidase subunit alpha